MMTCLPCTTYEFQLLPDTLGRQPSEQRHLGNGKMLLLGMMLDKRSIFFDGKLGRYPHIELDASAKPARRAHFATKFP